MTKTNAESTTTDLSHAVREFRRLLRDDPEAAMARSREGVEHLMAEAITPNAEQIARAWESRRVPVVVHDLASDDARAAARNLGWDGASTVFEMAPLVARLFAAKLRAIGDSAAAEWLTRGEPTRLFVMSGHGTLCLNFDPDRGWSTAPGTNDLASNN